MKSSASRALITGLLIAVTVAPIVFNVFSFAINSRAEENRFVRGDGAVLQLYTMYALRGELLLGPYSRYRWNHPGPTYFYCAAPVYALLGQNKSALRASASLITLVGAVSILIVVFFSQGLRRLGLAAILLSCYFIYMGDALDSYWNPYICVVPLVLLLFLCAAHAAGGRFALPFIAFWATFAIQTHLMYAPVVAVAVATALVLGYFNSERGDPDAAKPSLASWVAALLVLLVLWAPVAVEELSYHPGNLSKIIGFFTGGTAQAQQQDLWGLVSPFLRQIAWPLTAPAAQAGLEPGGLPFEILAALTAAAMLCLCVWVFIRARLRGDAFASSLALMSALGIVAALVSASRIVGDPHDYLVFWSSALGLTVVAAALLHLGAPDPKREAGARPGWVRIAAAVLIVCLCSTLSIARIEASKGPTSRPGYHRKITLPLVRFLDEKQPENFLVTFDQEDWADAAGVILALYKRGKNFCLPDIYISLFGRQFECGGENIDGVLHVAKRSELNDLKKRGGHTLVAANRAMCVFWVDYRSAMPRSPAPE